MLTLILGIIIFLFFLLIGFLVLDNFIYKKNILEESKGILLMSPILGAIIMVCLGETLFLFFPMKNMLLIYSLGIGILLFYKKKTLMKLKKYLEIKAYIFISLISGFLVSIPAFKRIEFNSPQIVNNDIAFYLSSMDWIYKNSYLNFKDLLKISPNMPYYALATYMIRETRIGTEVLGSQIMSLFFLEPHQIYFALGIAITMTTVITFSFLFYYVLKQNEKRTKIFLIIISVSLVWFELQRMQYVPQILGVGAMVLFLSVLLLFLEEDRLENKKLLGIAFAGTLSIYAEFSMYIFIYFIVTVVVCLIYCKKEKFKKIYAMIKGCLLGIIFSPFGVYKAIKFNLMILKQTKLLGNIDSFDGIIMSKYIVLSNFFGLKVRANDFHNISNIHFSDLDTWTRILNIILLLTMLGIFIMIIYIQVYKRTKINVVLGSLLLFFILNELSFRKLHFGYGEYKFLLSINMITITIILYFYLQVYSELIKLEKRKIVLKILTVEAVIFYIIVNFANILYMIRKDYYYYDNKLIELREISKKLPKDSFIDIPGVYNDVHSSVYALKDRKVRIKGYSYYEDLLSPAKQKVSGISYYIGTLKDMKEKEMNLNDYILELKNKKELNVVSFIEEKIWENSEYELIKYNNRDKVEVIFSNGIGESEIESSGAEVFRALYDKNNIIFLKNKSNKKLKLSIKIKLLALNGSEKEFEVVVDEKIKKYSNLGSVEFKNIELNPNEYQQIDIKIKNKLIKVDKNRKKILAKLKKIEIIAK